MNNCLKQGDILLIAQFYLVIIIQCKPFAFTVAMAAYLQDLTQLMHTTTSTDYASKLAKRRQIIREKYASINQTYSSTQFEHKMIIHHMMKLTARFTSDGPKSW